MTAPHPGRPGCQPRLMHKLCALIEGDSSSHQRKRGADPSQQSAVPRKLRALHSQVNSRVDLLFSRVDVFFHGSQPLLHRTVPAIAGAIDTAPLLSE